MSVAAPRHVEGGVGGTDAGASSGAVPRRRFLRPWLPAGRPGRLQIAAESRPAHAVAPAGGSGGELRAGPLSEATFDHGALQKGGPKIETE